MDRFDSYSDHPLLAEIYDLVPHYSISPDVPFYRRQAAATGGPVLELGCGTGRVLLPMAERGLTMTGLDLSPHMLARCRARLAELPAEVQRRVDLIEGSMAGFDLGRRFGLITIPFRAFQHLIAVEDQIACLTAVRRHLAPGGRLALDVFQTSAPRMHDPRYQELRLTLDWTEVAGGRRLRCHDRVAAYHRAEQVNEIELVYDLAWPDGREQRVVHAFPMRYFFRYEVEHLLARCGLRLIALYGDYDESELADDSPEMIAVAEAGPDPSPAA